MKPTQKRPHAPPLPRRCFLCPACPQALTGDRAGPQTAANALEEMFSGGGGKSGSARRRATIVLVDEMDLLVNKSQVGRLHECVM